MSHHHISLDLTDDQVTTALAGLDQLATALTSWKQGSAYPFANSHGCS